MRFRFAVLVISTVVSMGCDDKKASPPPKLQTQAERVAEQRAKQERFFEESGKADLVGTWRAVQGDPKTPGAFYSIMVLEVAPDLTVKLSTETADLRSEGAKFVKRAEGRITYAGRDDWVVNLERATAGSDIPPDQKQKHFRITTSPKGEHLSFQPSGPRFDRVKP